MNIEISAKRSLKVTLQISGILVLLHTVGHIFRFTFGYDDSIGIIRLFNLEYEQNIPTLWSALLLLYAALLLLALSRQIYKEGGKYVLYWTVLALAFFYLSADELFELHEKTIRPVHGLLHPGEGLFLYSWVIPATAALGIMGLVYAYFLFSLPRITRNLFVLCAVVYAGAAILFELPEGVIETNGGWMNLPYTILVTFEEALEMVGICLFAFAVIHYAAGRDSLTQEQTGIIWKS